MTVLPPITNVVTWNQDAVDIFVTNGLAFLARGTNGLAILSVTNPASPQLLGTLPTTSYTASVTVAGNLAYMADGLNGLRIISVTNPSNPLVIGSYPISSDAGQIVVRSNLVYVAGGLSGLVVLNASNPAQPSLVGSYATDVDAVGLCLLGNDAVIGSPNPISSLNGEPSYPEGLFTIDVSDPAHPNLVGQSSPGTGNLDVEGQYAFGIGYTLGFGYGELEIFTMTNPALPALVGSFTYYPITNSLHFPIYVSAYDVRLVNNLAYIVGYNGTNSEFFAVDVHDPTQPIPVGYYADVGQPTALAVDGNLIYIAGAGTPLEILRTPFNTSPVAAPLLALPGHSGFNLSIQGRHGQYYDVQYSDQLNGGLWQTLETILLTNDNAVITLPQGPARRFFRLKQDN